MFLHRCFCEAAHLICPLSPFRCSPFLSVSIALPRLFAGEPDLVKDERKIIEEKRRRNEKPIIVSHGADPQSRVLFSSFSSLYIIPLIASPLSALIFSHKVQYRSFLWCFLYPCSLFHFLTQSDSSSVLAGTRSQHAPAGAILANYRAAGRRPVPRDHMSRSLCVLLFLCRSR